jgi:hypothetical protein
MLSIFSVRRYSDCLSVYVDNEGMHIVTTRKTTGKDVQFSSWLVTEYPEAFIASAEHSLKGCQGFHTCFMFPVSDGFIDGRFGARQNDDWIDFFFTYNNKSIDSLLRPTEVTKLVRIIRQYWNK